MTSLISHALRAGWALASRSVRVQIQGHLLGYAWTMITPVLYAVCFIFIKQSLGNHDTSDPDHWWSVFRAFTGITLFQLWFQMLRDVSGFISTNRGMLKGLNVGLAPFVVGILFEGLLSMLIRVCTILIALPLLGLTFPKNPYAWLWMDLALGTLLLSALALGLVLAPWSVLYGDVRKALQSLSLPLVLISPIFYQAATRSDLPMFWVNVFNPIASPLAVISEAFRGIPLSYDVVLIGWFGFSFLLLVWGATQTRKQVPILLERMGS